MQNLRDNYPLPLIEDQIDNLRDKRYFTVLDLKSAFHHVNIEPDSVKYTSFVTLSGQLEYLRAPFGFKNSPSVFMRYINLIFKDLLIVHKISIYIDNIMIATKTVEENLTILKAVFQLLVQNYLTLRLGKCSFLYTRVTYLGYSIENNCIEPGSEHIKAICDFLVPRNLKELLRFISLAAYIRKFVKNFSEICRPLYVLLKKN